MHLLFMIVRLVPKESRGYDRKEEKENPTCISGLKNDKKRSEGGKRIFFRLYPEILTHRYRVLEKMKDIVKTDPVSASFPGPYKRAIFQASSGARQ